MTTRNHHSSHCDSNSKAIAYLAVKESRKRIFRSYSAIETNDAEFKKQVSIYQVIKSIREQYYTFSLLRVEANRVREDIRRLKKFISDIKKYASGNCSEHAHLAFEFILDNYPSVNAEIYKIHGGDHVFVVVGRAVDSNPSDPMTWGENAYFCDPWSDKVFKASNYQMELRNFRWRIESKLTRFIAYLKKKLLRQKIDPSVYRIERFTEPFNHDKHILKPVIVSTHQIQELLEENPESSEKTIAYVHERLLHLIKIITHLAEELQRLCNTILKKYGDNDEKYQAVKRKLLLAQQCIKEIKSSEDTSFKNNQLYSTVCYQDLLSKLTDLLRKHIEGACLLLTYEDDELKILQRPRTYFHRFFRLNPDTPKELTKISNRFINGLEESLLLSPR